jgi:hypothetical protein
VTPSATLSTTIIRPAADLVATPRLASGRDDGLKFGEQQVSTIQAAARVIATMPDSEVGRQAPRLAKLFTSRYDWYAWEVTTAVTDAVVHHFQTDKGSNLRLPRYVQERVSLR